MAPPTLSTSRLSMLSVLSTTALQRVRCYRANEINGGKHILGVKLVSALHLIACIFPFFSFYVTERNIKHRMFLYPLV